MKDFNFETPYRLAPHFARYLDQPDLLYGTSALPYFVFFLGLDLVCVQYTVDL